MWLHVVSHTTADHSNQSCLPCRGVANGSSSNSWLRPPTSFRNSPGQYSNRINRFYRPIFRWTAAQWWISSHLLWPIGSKKPAERVWHEPAAVTQNVSDTALRERPGNREADINWIKLQTLTADYVRASFPRTPDRELGTPPLTKKSTTKKVSTEFKKKQNWTAKCSARQTVFFIGFKQLDEWVYGQYC